MTNGHKDVGADDRPAIDVDDVGRWRTGTELEHGRSSNGYLDELLEVSGVTDELMEVGA